MHIDSHDFFTPHHGQYLDKYNFLPVNPASSKAQPLSPGSSGNDISLGGLSPAANQKILNQEILTALNKVLQADNATPIEQLNPDEFSPANVANRILNFVGLALANAGNNGADKQELQRLYQQAQDGIERGFNEARQILDGLGVLQGKIAEDIDQTYSLIQQGMTELADQLFATPATPASIYTERTTKVGAINSRSISLEIETRGGDKVTLTLSDTQGAHSLQQGIADGSAVKQISEQLIYASSNISYSVAGELDQQELNDITKLVKQVDRLAEKFFDGNFQGALRRALLLGNNTNELASFAVNMEMSAFKQVSNTYQSISSMDGGDATATPAAPGNDLMAAADFINSVNDVASLPRLEQQFKEPGKVFAELLDGVSKLHPDHIEKVRKIENQLEMSIKELIIRFIEAIKTQKEQQKAEIT